MLITKYNRTIGNEIFRGILSNLCYLGKQFFLILPPPKEKSKGRSVYGNSSAACLNTLKNPQARTRGVYLIYVSCLYCYTGDYVCTIFGRVVGICGEVNSGKR